MPNTITRRSFLGTSGSAALASAAVGLRSRLALARASTDSRFVFVLLRGALDGLSAVPPVGDPAYAGLRGQIALAATGPDAALPLEGPFGLHPSLAFLKRCYDAKELAVFHAVASPYRERSHFDAQDVLENGTSRPTGAQSGWVNRALAALPAGRAREPGVALGTNVPLAMRGPVPVATWAPSKAAPLGESTLARITDLYACDPLLSARLAEALQSDAIAEAAQREADESASTAAGGDAVAPTMTVRAADDKRAGGKRTLETARAAAGFLRRDDGARVAMFDTTGWDTHANEGGPSGQLAGRLGELDGALAALKEGLGPVWRNTAILIATEFGRTAAINGTRGTDHGTGAAAFLVGGAVAGGRVVADWPGLGHANLYEGRDLKPTRDLRAVLKGILRDHLGISAGDLARAVFPDSAGVAPLDGLVRG